MYVYLSGFLEWGYLNSWMVYFMENPKIEWIWMDDLEVISSILGNPRQTPQVKYQDPHRFPGFSSQPCLITPEGIRFFQTHPNIGLAA